MSTNVKGLCTLMALLLAGRASADKAMPAGHALYRIRVAMFFSALGHDVRGNTCTDHIGDKYKTWYRTGHEPKTNCSVGLRVCAFYRSAHVGTGCPEMPDDKLALSELLAMAKGDECPVRCYDAANDRSKRGWRSHSKGDQWELFSDTLLGKYAYRKMFGNLYWEIPVNHWAADGVLWLVGEADHMIDENGEQIRVLVDRFVGAVTAEDTSPVSKNRYMYYRGMTTSLDDSLFVFSVNVTCGDMPPKYYGCDCSRQCVDTYRFSCNNAGFPICNEHFYNPEDYDPSGAFKTMESTACSALCRPNARTGTLCGEHGNVLCALGYRRVKAMPKPPWSKGARANPERRHVCEKIACHTKLAHDDCAARGGTCMETAHRDAATRMFYTCA